MILTVCYSIYCEDIGEQRQDQKLKGMLCMVCLIVCVCVGDVCEPSVCVCV
jgi:hypothetical protein